MTYDEAHDIARVLRLELPGRMSERIKAIHVMPKLHNGHLTIRVFMIPVTAEDPEPFVFAADEI